jgi:hypothetical protein
VFWSGYQLDLSKELFGPNKRLKERQSYGDGKEGKATERKLFHLEGRSAPERHIIDTSERKCANHRYVIG